MRTRDLATRLRWEIIEEDHYQSGVMLPNAGDIAQRFQVSRNTVLKALHQLDAEGYVVVIPNKGVYVA